VKVIHAELADSTDFRARFVREVAAARKVSGLFTAPVVDAGMDDLVPWLATAYVQGPSLGEAVLSHGPLSAESVLALAAGLAEGLGAIHAAGVVHRDLKPSNVLLAEDGPRVIDFGISRAAEASALTRSGLVVGSPGFLSPEQAEGGEVGPASDVFSLGAVLAFAATGEGPFGTGPTAAMVYRVVHGQPHLDRLPPEIRSLTERCLAKDPAERPTTEQILAELAAVSPPDTDLAWMQGRQALQEVLQPAAPVLASREIVDAGQADISYPPDRPAAPDPMQHAPNEPATLTSATVAQRPLDPGQQRPEAGSSPAPGRVADSALGSAMAGGVPEPEPHSEAAAAAASGDIRGSRRARRAAYIAVAGSALVAAAIIVSVANLPAPTSPAPTSPAVPHSVSSSSAAGTRPTPAVQAGFTTIGSLTGADATTGGSVWAFGCSNPSAPTALIARWNGAAWQQAPGPSPGTYSEIQGLAATSTTSAWAVGYSYASGITNGLIEHWNGTAWTQVPSPSPTGGSYLTGVAAVSPTSAWAVGYSNPSAPVKALIEHWDGTSWNQVPSPSPDDSALFAVAATSATDAWAVGSAGGTALILHWDGTSWSQVPSPNPAGGVLTAVAATSTTNAWAVGHTGIKTGKTLILRWDGSGWTRVPSPNSAYVLWGVAATSATSAWAVGGTSNPNSPQVETLVVHWNGTTWS
jgi:serine/threonine protein kinase